ncbi:MAG: DUF1624 domain-containing protein [Acidobacteriota bacterium]
MEAKKRESTIDLLRGIVMVLMVVDHAQEYQAGPGRGLVTDPMNLAVTPGLVYFWRILAHFCAPVFTLLMGMSAWLSGASREKLLKRGLVMLALEFTVMNWAWTFNPMWQRYFFQIIGAMGVAMLVMAAMKPLGERAMLWTGVGLVAGHNLLDGIHFASGTWEHALWSLLHEKNVLPAGWGFSVRTTYPVLPVMGLGLAGYGLGNWWTRGEAPWVKTGLGMMGLFVALRASGVYGDPNEWERNSLALQSFLNVTKYPLSLQFVLMTVGPAMVFLGVARRRGWRQEQLEQLGRTAMFFYITHLVVLHAGALLAGVVAGGKVELGARFGGVPEVVGFPVWATAVVALGVTALLYPLCRWYEPRRMRYL